MLNKILEQKKVEVENINYPEIDCEVERKSLNSALSNPNRSLGIIAEVKKASPSKGIIREDFHPVAIAMEYEEARADAISVLTDERFFQGSINYLMDIKKKVNIPVLRKDFIVDAKQIKQSEKMGADVILLIGEALAPNQLHEYYCEAYERGLECLVEVHSRETLERVCSIFTPEILGVNNRNLKIFETSITHTEEIVNDAPSDSLVVSESGIHTPQDLKDIIRYGAKAALIGEAFMRASSPGIGIKQMFGEVPYATTSH
ncbi:indole-3-glycerol phosphate synthase TrpC [Fredinandcohnia sp. QZ13]|uniref:indole-3-glycerol phosphate synthase TrpC n=1 Tax=Fredinandcohnia sp. QZ13 TaxID=3073144 RepID=UPI0028532B65|nr:indole-3-glycerol phosphate synthase TrpC [Fredinandcohnia sp. QZ13]MDR4888712.1 indole-3-glycerol phosphate synthase TrpC [Fredinandcohnia sp. QZ13]